jgi:PhzF family phenazine biosynthesis protein
MKIPIFTVDAFTDKPFSGNPAAVCILNEVIYDSVMQSIAYEMNLSETAFLLKPASGTGRQDEGYSLRWFTPTAEVDLCGHATLSSAHILWEEGLADTGKPVQFQTKSGLLFAHFKGDKIEMDFPAISEKEVSYPADLIHALGGVEPKYVGMTRWNYVVELENESAVKSVKPDYARLLALPGWGTMITAKSDSGDYDFVSRFFAPEKGVPEDPVTGSAHCALGPFWQKRLGKKEFIAYQASSRGGSVGVRVEGDRVFLSGKAVTVIKGEINI